MQLLDHVSLSVPDLARARPFYHAIFNALGAVVVYDHADAIGYGERCERITTPITTRHLCATRLATGWRRCVMVTRSRRSVVERRSPNPSGVVARHLYCLRPHA